MSQINQQLVDQLDEFRELYYTKRAEAAQANAEADGAFAAIQELLVPVLQAGLQEEAPETEPDLVTPPPSGLPIYEFPKEWEKWIMLESGGMLSDVRVEGLKHVGISASLSGGPDPAEGITIHNVEIDGASHWGSRMHNVKGVVWSGCTIRNVEREHGIYANVSWSDGDSLSIENVLIENVGGQAVQTVWREDESYDVEKDRQPGGRIMLNQVHARRTGWNYGHGRNAYAFTFGDLEGVDRPAYMVACTLDNTMLEQSRGMLVIEPRSSAHVVGCSFRHTRADRQTAVLASGVSNLVIQDSHFEATNPSDYDRLYLKNIDRLTIQGCTGNLPVYRDGELLGPISEISLSE